MLHELPPGEITNKILDMISNWALWWNFEHKVPPQTVDCGYCCKAIHTHNSEQLADCIKHMVKVQQGVT